MAHRHNPAYYCMCCSYANEPNEDCPIHGFPINFFCIDCGQFMKRTQFYRIVRERQRRPRPISDLGKEEKEMTEQAIREAVARGWCDPANSHKEMDAILAESIVREVMQALESVREEALISLEAAAGAVCYRCAHGERPKFVVCFKGDAPEWYHIEIGGAMGGKDDLYRRCDAHAIRALSPARVAEGDEYDQKSVDIIKNLAMLVRRLCYKHPNEKLTDQAMAYLRGEKLEGNILRDAPESPAKEQPGEQEQEPCAWRWKQWAGEPTWDYSTEAPTNLGSEAIIEPLYPMPWKTPPPPERP